MGKRKLIASDLDGTLLDKNGTISDDSIDYLCKLKEEGHVIVIATGRMFSHAVSVTKGVNFSNYIITDQGCGIFDMSNNKPLYINKINDECVKRFCEFIKDDYAYYLMLNNSDYQYIYKNADLKFISKQKFRLTVSDKNDFIINTPQTTKIVVGPRDEESIRIIFNEIEKNYPNLEGLLMYNSFNEEHKWIEIFNKGTSKYNAIKKIADKEGILNEDIIVFGDSLNDVDMITKCGVGVAVENAIDELKKRADYIAPSHEEDGVIKFLKNYLSDY